MIRTRFTYAETAILRERIDAAMLVLKERAKWLKAFGHILEAWREQIVGKPPDGSPPVGVVNSAGTK